MQKIILALSLVIVTGLTAVAQCDKKIKWTASKAEMYDQSGNVIDNKTATFLITMDSKNILLDIVENEEDKLEGTVGETTCEWKEAFKAGKSSSKVNMMNKNGETSAGTISVEGKDGKLIITFTLDMMNGKYVKIYVDKYEVL
jgi:hypothetical protein